jgi:hypothetical protein
LCRFVGGTLKGIPTLRGIQFKCDGAN